MLYRKYMEIFGYTNHQAIRFARRAHALTQSLEKQASEGAIPVSGAADYLVTPDGIIYSIKIGRIIRLSPGTKPGGYKFVGLKMDDGTVKYQMVHRLVASAFVANPLGLPEVNHIDSDKANNCSKNLEWCTRRDNAVHMMDARGIRSGSTHFLCKLTDEQVRSIRAASGTYKSIGKAHGVSAQTVCNVKRLSKYADVT